jgi:hypothetical protein
MRGNGLSADHYVAVADLDSRTADLLLAQLRARGVAAYAADSPDRAPGGPVDRLYVDAAAEGEARSMIDEQLASGAGDTSSTGSTTAPSGPDIDFDSAFADIVAGFHQAAGGPETAVGRWSADEDLDQPPSGGDASSEAGAGSAPPSGVSSSYVGWDDVLRPDPPAPAPQPDPEERYVPPPPPPLPRGDLRAWVAWGCVVGGPALLFAAAIFSWSLDPLILLGAVVAFLGGFVALVARLKDRPDDDGGDDGAVV